MFPLKKTLNEETTTSGVDNIQQTDQLVPLIDVYQQTNIASLARQLFTNVKLNGPSASIFALSENPTKSGSLALIKRSIECFPSEPIKTEITQEAYQDLAATYGKVQAGTHVGIMLRSIAAKYENEKLLEFLDANAKDAGSLSLSDKLNAETRMFEITNAVQTCVLEANSKFRRTFSSFAIVPYKFVSSIMTTSAYTTGENSTNYEYLMVAHFGISGYYLNPDPNSNTVYVGLHRDWNRFDGSCYFGDYTNFVERVISQESGQNVYYIYDRFALAMHPCHTDDNPMLFKFTIND